MTITLGITIAILAGAVGFMLGTAVMVKTPPPTTTPAPPQCGASLMKEDL